MHIGLPSYIRFVWQRQTAVSMHQAVLISSMVFLSARCVEFARECTGLLTLMPIKENRIRLPIPTLLSVRTAMNSMEPIGTFAELRRTQVYSTPRGRLLKPGMASDLLDALPLA